MSDSSQPPPPPRRHETPINDELRREPDELDALLQRTASGEDDDEESNATTIQQPTDYLSTGSSNASSNDNPRGHRKAHTAAGDLFHKAGLNRISGLFGRDKKSIRARKRQQHRKNKSSLSDLLVQNLHLEPIVEDFQHLSSSINNIWIEELEEMDQGTNNGFFDMTATRSLVRY
jgi:hypothetical protein